MKKIDIGILCGGKSSRMGTDKAELILSGESFLERLTNRLKVSGDIYYSTVKGKENEIMGSRIVYDIYENCGGLGGLHALLHACSKKYLFVTAVDLPFIDNVFVEELCSYLSPGIDAVIPIDEDGRIHPLCGLYRKDVEKQAEESLLNGEKRIRKFLDQIRVCYIPVHQMTDGRKKIDNINYPEDYERIKKALIPIVCFAGYSNSGKTTFIEKMIIEMKSRCKRVAVIKHDGHDFEIDQEGKDSYRFTKAGASPVILSSKSKTVSMYQKEMPIENLVALVEDVDLILIEGFKKSNYPKILIHRDGMELAVDIEKEQPILILSDKKSFWQDKKVNCNILGLDDVKDAADYLEKYIII